MSGLDVASFLRRLATLSDVKLGALYTVGILPATLLNELGEALPEVVWLKWLAAVAALCALSLAVTVMTFYRDYDSGLSAILLALMTGAGTAIAWVVTMVTFAHSIQDILVLAVIGALGLLWRLVLLTPALAVCVWLLRKFRRWFAPDTQTDAT